MLEKRKVKMKIKFKNMALALLAAVVAAAMPVLKVSAASVTIGSDGSGTTNGSATIPFVRKITNVTNNVTNTFTYTIAADASNPAGATGLPTSAQAVFNAVVPTGGTATVNSAINFTNATFTTVGDYRFTITETGSTDPTNYPRSTETYTALVSVRNVMAGNTPTGNLEVTLVQSMQNSAGDKVTGTTTFTSSSNRTYAQISSAVAGNNADTNKCFKYQINIAAQAAAPAGDVYKVSSTSTCAGSSANVTVGGASNFIFLKAGESATIGLNGTTNQMPLGVSYTVAKVGDTDYTTYFDGSTTAGTVSANKTTVAVGAANYAAQNTTSVVNTKSTAVLTGIITNSWFYLIIVLVGAMGVSYYMVRRHAQNKA